jgi:hypothetical protein
MHEEVVIRHAASNQLQRNAPHCKPPAAPKRPPDRSQTAPAPACGYPALRLAITDEASPLALRSTRNRPRRAVRRGAAWPPVERPSNCLDAAAGSPARWQASPPSHHARRVPRVPPTATRFAVRAASWCPGCRDAHRGLGRPVRIRVASVRPSSVRCPVRVQASARPVSRARCLRMRCPRVRCPMSGCGRPVSRVGVRAFRVRVRRVCIP